MCSDDVISWGSVSLQPACGEQTADTCWSAVVVRSLCVIVSAPGRYLAAVHRPESTEKVYAPMM